MKFEDTGLPRHPSIEKAFADLVKLDAQDEFTSRGIAIARLIAAQSRDKDPDAIAAALYVPFTLESGPLTFARTELTARASEIVQSVFAVGSLAMRHEPVEDLYRQQDAPTRAVILAASACMFAAAADEMIEIIEARRKSGAAADAQFLRKAFAPLSAFTAEVTRAETVETSLVKHCQNAVARIEEVLTAIDSAPAPEARKPAPEAGKPAPRHHQP
ncbi:MAG: hypothetical protein PW788_00995 [Micavibrio sp.]|nr:hypothetical protein [Micavibrio sp.]